MLKATLTIAAFVALAACDASMTTTGAGDPFPDEGFTGGQEGADPPGTSGPDAAWWGLPG